MFWWLHPSVQATEMFIPNDCLFCFLFFSFLFFPEKKAQTHNHTPTRGENENQKANFAPSYANTIK